MDICCVCSYSQLSHVFDFLCLGALCIQKKSHKPASGLFRPVYTGLLEIEMEHWAQTCLSVNMVQGMLLGSRGVTAECFVKDVSRARW